MLFDIALLVHVAGAIIGIGPTFAFAIMGKAVGDWPGEGSLALIETMLDIEKKLVTPVVAVTQPLTGIYLIFASGRAQGFFSFEWLWVSILLYIGILIISYGLDVPLIHRVVSAMREGNAGTPEFSQMVRRTKVYGMIMGISTVIIIVLMVLKPGDF